MSTSIMIFDRAFGKWNSLSLSEMFFLTYSNQRSEAKKVNIKKLEKEEKRKFVLRA